MQQNRQQPVQVRRSCAVTTGAGLLPPLSLSWATPAWDNWTRQPPVARCREYQYAATVRTSVISFVKEIAAGRRPQHATKTPKQQRYARLFPLSVRAMYVHMAKLQKRGFYAHKNENLFIIVPPWRDDDLQRCSRAGSDDSQCIWRRRKN